jgi:ADP-ribose pyrophosphatase
MTFQEPRASRPQGDRPADTVTLSTAQVIGRGYRRYDRFVISRLTETAARTEFERDILRSGQVVGVLPVDLKAGQIVLTRQFRLGGHLAGRGDMIEIVAGRVDAGETVEDAARRECQEEIGIAPVRLARLFEFSPAPALTDEFMTLFLAEVHAAHAPDAAGVRDEDEDEAIEVVPCPISRSFELLRRKELHSGSTILALQWLALNHKSLEALLSTTFHAELPDVDGCN